MGKLTNYSTILWMFSIGCVYFILLFVIAYRRTLLRWFDQQADQHLREKHPEDTPLEQRISAEEDRSIILRSTAPGTWQAIEKELDEFCIDLRAVLASSPLLEPSELLVQRIEQLLGKYRSLKDRDLQGSMEELIGMEAKQMHRELSVAAIKSMWKAEL